MVDDTERALAVRIATLDLIGVLVEVEGLVEGTHVAALAHVSPVEADVLGDVAAEPALVVDELLTVARLVALKLANTDLLRQARLAPKDFLLDAKLLTHSLPAVYHSTKVWLIAKIAQIEGARGKGQAAKIFEKLVSRI